MFRIQSVQLHTRKSLFLGPYLHAMQISADSQKANVINHSDTPNILLCFLPLHTGPVSLKSLKVTAERQLIQCCSRLSLGSAGETAHESKTVWSLGVGAREAAGALALSVLRDQRSHPDTADITKISEQSHTGPGIN